MVQRLGDGQLICSKHWAKEFDKPEPETGWIAGECDFCLRSKAAAMLGQKGGRVKSKAKSEAAKKRNAARKAGLKRFLVFYLNGDRKEIKARDEDEARNFGLSHCDNAKTSIMGIGEL